MESKKNLLQYGSAIGIAYIIGIPQGLITIFLILITFNLFDYSLIALIATIIAAGGTINIFYLLLKEQFINIFKRFKEAQTWVYILAFFILSISSLLVFSLLISSFFDIAPDNANEESLNQLKKYGILFYLFVVILAPIVEEFIFRFFIFKLAKRKSIVLAYIIVISSFALIHLISSIYVAPTNSINTEPILFIPMGSQRLIIPLAAILTIPGYLIPSAIMTYVADKYDNLAIAIGIHIANNLIASIGLVVLFT